MKYGISRVFNKLFFNIQVLFGFIPQLSYVLLICSLYMEFMLRKYSYEHMYCPRLNLSPEANPGRS